MADAKGKSTNSRPRGAAHETERAEEILEQVSRRLSRFITTGAARVREEAEDIWAEAQSVRRGDRK